MSDTEDIPPSEAIVAPVGTVLAEKYRIVRQLGEGGMGAVYEAEHTFLRRRFAIKFLRPELAREAELVARFRREAQAAGQLEHESIASVTDFGITPGGSPYLVMEFLEGETLSSLLSREGSLGVLRAVSFALQACRGLGVAHARGIVHRDLKPDNLFVGTRDDGTEWIKLLDFGIAKVAVTAHDGSFVTQTGVTMGTPHYMSPEQARGERNVDHRTDVYSLGAVLYETLCGDKPYAGTTYNEILYQIITGQPQSLRVRRPDLPADLCAVVERAMARNAEDRFASMPEFAAALAAWFGPAPRQGLAHRVRLAAGEGHSPTVPSPASRAPRAPSGRSSPTTVLVVGAFALVSFAAMLVRNGLSPSTRHGTIAPGSES